MLRIIQDKSRRTCTVIIFSTLSGRNIRWYPNLFQVYTGTWHWYTEIIYFGKHLPHTLHVLPMCMYGTHSPIKDTVSDFALGLCLHNIGKCFKHHCNWVHTFIWKHISNFMSLMLFNIYISWYLSINVFVLHYNTNYITLIAEECTAQDRENYIIKARRMMTMLEGKVSYFLLLYSKFIHFCEGWVFYFGLRMWNWHYIGTMSRTTCYRMLWMHP